MPHPLNESAERFFAALDDSIPFSDLLKEDLLDVMTSRSLKKDEFLLKPGQVSQSLYFIDRGLLRSYVLVQDPKTKKQSEESNEFIRENDIYFSLGTLGLGKDNAEYIQAVDPSELILHKL